MSTEDAPAYGTAPKRVVPVTSAQVAAARAHVEANRRLGEDTPRWIREVAAVRTKFDPEPPRPAGPAVERRALVRALRRRRCVWCGRRLLRPRYTGDWCGRCAEHGTGMPAPAPCPQGARVDPADVDVLARALVSAYGRTGLPDDADIVAARRILVPPG